MNAHIRILPLSLLGLGLWFGALAPVAASEAGLDASMQALNQARSTSADCADCPDPAPAEEEEEEIELVAPADSLLETAGKDRSGPEFNGRESDRELPDPGLLQIISNVPAGAADAAQPASTPIVAPVTGLTGG